MQTLVIATTNKGKIKEFQKLLEKFPFELKNLKDFGIIPEVEETGKTFAANAELKATYYAQKTNSWAMADDSGLEVEALNNAPGVYSARYSGKNASDQDNVKKLLNELKKTNDSQKNARFVCEMAIADESGKIIFNSRGICEGKIASQPIGNNGFGYDPVFIPNEYSETFGQLSSEIKQQISHRSKAVKKIIKYLSNFRTS